MATAQLGTHNETVIIYTRKYVKCKYSRSYTVAIFKQRVTGKHATRSAVHVHARAGGRHVHRRVQPTLGWTLSEVKHAYIGETRKKEELTLNKVYPQPGLYLSLSTPQHKYCIRQSTPQGPNLICGCSNSANLTQMFAPPSLSHPPHWVTAGLDCSSSSATSLYQSLFSMAIPSIHTYKPPLSRNSLLVLYYRYVLLLVIYQCLYQSTPYDQDRVR